jgi:hypothetical protein
MSLCESIRPGPPPGYHFFPYIFSYSSASKNDRPGQTAHHEPPPNRLRSTFLSHRRLTQLAAFIFVVAGVQHCIRFPFAASYLRPSSSAENKHNCSAGFRQKFRLKDTGFTGCGKTHIEANLRGFCNKGTALAGPKTQSNQHRALAPEGYFFHSLSKSRLFQQAVQPARKPAERGGA